MTIIVIYLLTALDMALMIWGQQTFAPIIPTFPPPPIKNAVINESVVVLAGEPVIVGDDVRVVIDCGQLIDRAIMSGIPNPTVNWLKDETLLDRNGSVPNVIISGDRRRLIITDTLLAVGGQLGNEGYYTCDVCTDFTDSNCNITTPVCVCGEPNISPPTGPAVVTPGFIRLTCGQDVVVPTLQGVATLLFQCSIFNGSILFSAIFKDGVQIRDNFQLILPSPSDADFGTYTFGLLTECCGSTMAVSRIIQAFTVSFKQPAYNVIESGRPAQLVLILNIPSSTAFNITVTSTDGSATGGVEYGSGPYTVTFPAGIVRAPFDIPLFDDNVYEGDENFILTIDPSSLPSGRSVGTTGQAIVTIADDDPITVMFSKRRYRVDEDNGPAQPVLVFSDPPFIDITVQVRDISGAATSGEDYDSGIYTVMIPAGMPMVPFKIPIIDDNILEGNEDFDIVLVKGSLPAGVTRGSPGRATVTIVNHNLSLPKFSKQPDDVNVTVCNSASFVCTARGYGLVKITWKRVNYALPITAEVTQEESLNQITSTLKIFEIIGYYSGQYYCVAANRDVEIASQIVNLHVTKIRRPEMIISFENITVLPNQDVQISCLASSLGVLTYDWSKRNGNLSNNVFKSYAHKNFYNSFGSEIALVYDLAIHNVQPLNEGWYCCTATNEAGTTTDCIWLEVNTLPYIIMQPTSDTFKARDLNVTAVSCKAVGIGPIYYRWEKYYLKNNSWIRPSHGAISITSPNLQFKIITEEDEGTYRCIVTNDDGDVISDNATVFVYVQEDCSVTNITGSLSHNRRRTRLQFSSDNPRATYRCKLDDEKFENCNSPVVWRNLKLGRHTVVVSASCIDDEGNTSSVRRTFEVQVR